MTALLLLYSFLVFNGKGTRSITTGGIDTIEFAIEVVSGCWQEKIFINLGFAWTTHGDTVTKCNRFFHS